MKQDILKTDTGLGADPNRLVTAEELLRLSEAGYHYELLKGRLVPMSPTVFKHDKLRYRLSVVLGSFVEQHDLGEIVSGETGFTLSQPGEPDTVRASDIAFIRQERLPPEDDPAWNNFLFPLPDLVVEIVSPSQYRPEITDKVKEWLAAGVRLVWVIWPKAKTVEVWRPGSDSPVAILGVDDTLDGLDVVPGFIYSVAQLFRQGRST